MKSQTDDTHGSDFATVEKQSFKQSQKWQNLFALGGGVRLLWQNDTTKRRTKTRFGTNDVFRVGRKAFRVLDMAWVSTIYGEGICSQGLCSDSVVIGQKKVGRGLGSLSGLRVGAIWVMGWWCQGVQEGEYKKKAKQKGPTNLIF